MVKNLDLGAKLWLCARHRFLCNQPRWKNLWKKNSFQCSVLWFTKHCKLNWVFHLFILFSFFGMVYLMHILVLTVPVKAERLKCSEYNFAPQHIGAAGNLSCIAFGVGNKIWIASANILLSPNDWKILANFTLLNTLMICSSYFSSVLLLMCPHQKEKLEGDNLSFYPTANHGLSLL